MECGFDDRSNDVWTFQEDGIRPKIHRVQWEYRNPFNKKGIAEDLYVFNGMWIAMSKRYAIDRWSIVDYQSAAIESLGAHVANL